MHSFTQPAIHSYVHPFTHSLIHHSVDPHVNSYLNRPSAFGPTFIIEECGNADQQHSGPCVYDNVVSFFLLACDSSQKRSQNKKIWAMWDI